MKNASALATTLTLAALAACSSGGDDDLDPAPDPGDPVEESEIDQLVRSVPPLPADPPSRTESEPSPTSRRGDYQCVTRTVTETQQHEDLVAFAANSEAMWPGA